MNKPSSFCGTNGCPNKISTILLYIFITFAVIILISAIVYFAAVSNLSAVTSNCVSGLCKSWI